MPLPNLGVLRIVHDAMHTHTHTHTDPTAFKKPGASDASDASSRLEDLLTDDEILHILKIVMKYYDLFDPAMIRDLPLINKRMRTLLIKEVEALKLKHYIFTLRGKLNDAQKQLFRPGSQSWDFSGLQSPADISLIGTIIHLLDPGDKPSELIFRDMPRDPQSGYQNTEQIEALANVITKDYLKSLTLLDIRGNKINNETLQNLASAIRGGGLQSLKHLDLGSCYIAVEGSGMDLFFDALINEKGEPTLPSLENLILNNNRIYAAGMLKFATAVKAGALKSLKHLELRSTHIGYNGGITNLSTAITAGELQSLQHLDLSDNYIGRLELNAFAEAVKQTGTLPSLQHLNLAGSGVDIDGLGAFASVVQQNGVLPSLQNLIM